MEPLYTAKYHEDPEAMLAALMPLDWLKVREARMEYFMSDVLRSYSYGKDQHAKAYESKPFTPEVQAVLDKLNAPQPVPHCPMCFGSGRHEIGECSCVTACDYNVCFLNRYDDHWNQLGWHSDDSPTMDTEHPIAVVSFGAEREIWWREIGFKGTIPKEQRQLLKSGSLFVMPAHFQEHYQHRIPKNDRACSVRVSLTFRRYK